jgi:hypothetical protein
MILKASFMDKTSLLEFMEHSRQDEDKLFSLTLFIDSNLTHVTVSNMISDCAIILRQVRPLCTPNKPDTNTHAELHKRPYVLIRETVFLLPG